MLWHRSKAFRDVSGGFVFLEGHDMQGPDDILLDDWAAKAKHVTVGDTFACWTTNFTSPESSIMARARASLCPLPLCRTFRLARQGLPLLHQVHPLRPHPGRDGRNEAHFLQGYQIRPLKDYLSLMTSANLPGLDAFIESMIALAVTIGFLVILLSMYTTVIERTRDIGVLKSIGASIHHPRAAR